MENQDLQAQEIVETETTETQAQAAPTRRVSNHINHENCIELRRLLEKIDPTVTEIVRGTKNAKFVPLVTEKENELLAAFIETDYNIKKTGEILGCTHTNVWQRLYGNNKEVNRAIGILGKLKKYEDKGYATKLPVVEAEEESKADTKEPAQAAEIA